MIKQLFDILDHTCFQLILKQKFLFYDSFHYTGGAKQANAVGDASYKTTY